MNRIETLKILAVLKAAFPGFCRDLGSDDYKAIVLLWNSQFADCGYEEISLAVQALISRWTGWGVPPIGAVKEELWKLRHPKELTGKEAWGLMLKAIRSGSSRAREEYEKLPPEVQAITSPAEISELGMKTDINHSVEESNFIRSFTESRQKQKELELLPPGVRAKMKILSDNPASKSVT